jgi:hypothetical protein
MVDRHGRGATAESEDNSAVVAKIALILIALSKIIAEAGQHKIKLRRPDRNVSANWDIKSATNDEIKSVVAWIARCTAGSLAGFEEVLISIGMRSTKHDFYERLEVWRTMLEDGSYVVGEQIGVCLNRAAYWTGAVGGCREVERSGKTLVARELGLDPKKVVDVHGHAAAATVQ